MVRDDCTGENAMMIAVIRYDYVAVTGMRWWLQWCGYDGGFSDGDGMMITGMAILDDDSYNL